MAISGHAAGSGHDRDRLLADGAGGTAPSHNGSSAGGSGSTATVYRREYGTMQPERQRPIHLPNIERHNQPVIVFLTVCTSARRPILANDAMHRLLVAAWAEAGTWHVGQYMIMPEHVHLFCSPAVLAAPNVRTWAGYWKSLVSRAVKGFGPLAELWTGAGGAGGTAPSHNGSSAGGSGSTPTESEKDPLWQTDCWDTQLRHVNHYAEKWEYVRANSVRKGLAPTSAAWPYQGCLRELRW